GTDLENMRGDKLDLLYVYNDYSINNLLEEHSKSKNHDRSVLKVYESNDKTHETHKTSKTHKTPRALKTYQHNDIMYENSSKEKKRTYERINGVQKRIAEMCKHKNKININYIYKKQVVRLKKEKYSKLYSSRKENFDPNEALPTMKCYDSTECYNDEALLYASRRDIPVNLLSKLKDNLRLYKNSEEYKNFRKNLINDEKVGKSKMYTFKNEDLQKFLCEGSHFFQRRIEKVEGGNNVNKNNFKYEPKKKKSVIKNVIDTCMNNVENSENCSVNESLLCVNEQDMLIQKIIQQGHKYVEEKPTKNINLNLYKNHDSFPSDKFLRYPHFAIQPEYYKPSGINKEDNLCKAQNVSTNNREALIMHQEDDPKRMKKEKNNMHITDCAGERTKIDTQEENAFCKKLVAKSAHSETEEESMIDKAHDELNQMKGNNNRLFKSMHNNIKKKHSHSSRHGNKENKWNGKKYIYYKILYKNMCKNMYKRLYKNVCNKSIRKNYITDSPHKLHRSYEHKLVKKCYGNDDCNDDGADYDDSLNRWVFEKENQEKKELITASLACSNELCNYKTSKKVNKEGIKKKKIFANEKKETILKDHNRCNMYTLSNDHSNSSLLRKSDDNENDDKNDDANDDKNDGK
ncbi:conserved Plasmodium protein, unknown function, partial [Plasmodium malariae]